MNYNIISTGSHGNAVTVNKSILIDCGVPFSRLKTIYRDLKLVLLTHIHADHFKKSTVRRLAADRPSLRFGCCEWLYESLIECGVPKTNIDVYETGKKYDYGVFAIAPLKLYHDVPNCGYRLYIGLERALYATDTKTLAGIEAKGYDLYMIEANYKETELQERIFQKKLAGEFSYEMDARERHLSYEQAVSWLSENSGESSKTVFLHKHIERKQK